MVTFESEALRKLSSPDQLELLNAIDRLRLQGISNYVSLPQIIVCGDQSSGKSSVLEALAGVPFPVKSNLCTRFPTELVLRRSPYISANVSIKPDESRSESERLTLGRFSEGIDGFDGLPAVIESAKQAMGISMHGKAFSKDLLRVEISGPDYPHLTIVDLPGLIHSETKQQTAADVELVQEVVQSYMEEARSIILAVVSAKNDFANQIVLKLARKADPNGHRTLGVITKPDTLTPGSVSESLFVSLARNQEFEFRLGWHVLKNLDSEKDAGNLVDRDTREAQFFSQGIWTNLPLATKGIDRLRNRLNKVLLKQISSELPGLIHEIDTKFKNCHEELVKLGTPRTSEIEQRRYLLQVSQAFQALVKSAVDASYNDPFFGDANANDGYYRRMRAVIQNLNEDFAREISQRGHLRNVVTDASQLRLVHAFSPQQVTQDKFLDHIELLMRRTRGRELPGTVNPLIVTELFREQCQPWEGIASRHVERVWKAVRKFLSFVMKHLADDWTSKSLDQDVIEPAMKKLLTALQEKTNSLLKPHKSSHPITYNHYFTETLQKVRRERLGVKDPRTILEQFFNQVPSGQNYISGYFDLEKLAASLCQPNEADMNRYAAKEAMDCLDAYYKVAVKRFIDDVCVQVVEEGLVSEIGQILSPMSVCDMEQTQVTRVAGESEECRMLREDLTKQLDIFAKGLETCKKFSGLRINGDSIFTSMYDSDDPDTGTPTPKTDNSREDPSNGTLELDHPTVQPDVVREEPEPVPEIPYAEPVPTIPEPEPEDSFGSFSTSKKTKKKKGKTVRVKEEPTPEPLIVSDEVEAVPASELELELEPEPAVAPEPEPEPVEELLPSFQARTFPAYKFGEPHHRQWFE